MVSRGLESKVFWMVGRLEVYLPLSSNGKRSGFQSDNDGSIPFRGTNLTPQGGAMCYSYRCGLGCTNVGCLSS